MSIRSPMWMAAAESLAIAKHAAPANSQEAAKKSGEENETVVVRGRRPSFAKLLKAKRESQTVIDVLTAEDVGKFPYKNVAEVLQRISGVSISREFDEGESVSIRDTALRAATTS